MKMRMIGRKLTVAARDIRSARSRIRPSRWRRRSSPMMTNDAMKMPNAKTIEIVRPDPGGSESIGSQ
jgi:hypothetical protein